MPFRAGVPRQTKWEVEMEGGSDMAEGCWGLVC